MMLMIVLLWTRSTASTSIMKVAPTNFQSSANWTLRKIVSNISIHISWIRVETNSTIHVTVYRFGGSWIWFLGASGNFTICNWSTNLKFSTISLVLKFCSSILWENFVWESKIIFDKRHNFHFLSTISLLILLVKFIFPLWNMQYQAFISFKYAIKNYFEVIHT